jgi:hypothetical protein
MSKKRKYGRKSDTFGAAHAPVAKEGGRITDIAGNSLAAVSKHSKGSLSTYRKPQKKSRQLTKIKRKQNRGS